MVRLMIKNNTYEKVVWEEILNYISREYQDSTFVVPWPTKKYRPVSH